MSTVPCARAPGIVSTNEDQGFYIRDSVAFVGSGAKTWNVGWGRNMEWPSAAHVDAAKMQKTCTGEFCLSYWRKCDEVTAAAAARRAAR